MLDKQLWALLGDLPGGAEVISQVKRDLEEFKICRMTGQNWSWARI